MKFHHVGIACNNIEEIHQSIEKIFPEAKINEIIHDPLQEADLSLVIIGDFIVELISGKPVKKLLNKGISLYHICFSVADIQKTIIKFCSSGAIMVSDPKPSILFNNNLVAFLYTKLGLIELLEEIES